MKPFGKSIRPALIGIAAIVVFGTGLALADSTATVTMTATGPQPETATVNWGETVDFVNADSIPHSLASTDTEIGTTTVGPGQTLPLTFAGKVGLKHYVMSGKPKSFFGPAVAVTLIGTIDVAARPNVVRYGQSTQLVGHVSLGSDAAVSIQARPLNRFGNGTGTWGVVAGPFSTQGTGAFSYGTTPNVGAEYQAVAAAGQLVSKPIAVAVTPFIAFTAPRRVKAGRVFTIHLSVRPSKATRTVDLEEYVPGQKRFHAVGRVHVTSAGTGVAHVSVQTGRWRFQLSVPSAGLAVGLVAGTSNTFVVTAA